MGGKPGTEDQCPILTSKTIFVIPVYHRSFSGVQRRTVEKGIRRLPTKKSTMTFPEAGRG